MKVTVGMAILFRHFVLELRRSPYDARKAILEAFPDGGVPCLKTFYNHVEAGDTGVFHGQTPYHPGRRRKPREAAHEAKTVPGRRYVVKRLGHVNQDEVVRAIGRMKARKALPTVRSATTDNGCEFLDQRRLDRAFKAETYYTRAYASYEKGAARELQPPRQEMASEGNGLQQAHETADPAARGLDQHNPQRITQRRDCVCLRSASGPDGLGSFCRPTPFTSHRLRPNGDKTR